MSAIHPPSYPVPSTRPPFAVSSAPVAGSTWPAPVEAVPPPPIPPGPPPPPTPPSPSAGWPPPSEHPGRPASQVGRGYRLKRFALVAAALALVGGGLALDRSGLAVVPVLFVLVVPFEKLFPRHRQKLRRPQLGTDIGYALAGPLLSGIGIAAAVVVAIVSLAWLPGLAIRPLVGMIPPAIAPFVGIALFDLAIYWTHRWYHEVPILWRFHAIHHSPDHMDWISGFRNHPFDGTLIAPAFIFLVAAGFSAEFTGVLAIIQFVLGIFLHANVRWRLRPLHRVVITPEFHHWHHANEPGAINSNYSVFLPAWDLIFGTYFMPRHRRPQVYGVTEYIPPGMAAQLWHPLRGMGNPLRLLRHPIRSVRAGFRFTGRLLVEMKRSATRPRRRSRDDIGPPPLAGTRLPDPSIANRYANPASGSATTPYSPYFSAPPQGPWATAGSGPAGAGSHTAILSRSVATEVYGPRSLAEIMRWDEDGR